MTEQEHREENERLTQLPRDDLFRQEARRLAGLTAVQRKEALAVHRRIADDPRRSTTTSDYARYVADTLEALIDRLLKLRKK